MLLHRDFDPGNVLWRRGTVSGAVDWQDARTGPAVAGETEGLLIEDMLARAVADLGVNSR